MDYKWLKESSKQSIVRDDGITHTSENERYWIDVIKLEHCKLTVELNYMRQDDEKPFASCRLIFNDFGVMESYAPTLEEVEEIGERLIQQIKDSVNSTT